MVSNDIKVNWMDLKSYSTFIPMLLRAMSITDGPVIELGSGPSSTPLLHWLCKEQKRRLFTYEKDPDFYRVFRRFRSGYHSISLVESWAEFNTRRSWSVALIDHDIEEENARAKTALRLRNKADFILLHDSDHEDLYGYGKIYDKFKYKYTWKFARPWTTVVSNLKEMPWE